MGADLMGQYNLLFLPTAGQIRRLGKILAANFNSTADQTFVLDPGVTTFYITGGIATNSATNMTTAAGGIYTGAAKTGTIIVAAAQVYTGMTGTPTSAQALTITAAGLANTFAAAPIFSLTTAQGAAANADVYLFGLQLS
jgi:hypothetical protein